MARHGGQVQLEQSDMRWASSMAKMAEGGFLCAIIEGTHYQIKKPRAEVQEEKKWGVEFPRHKNVKASIERHLAMFIKTTWPDTFLVTMAPQRICRHSGDTKEQVYLHPTNADSLLQT